MKMKVIAVFVFLANPVLFATYYAVAKEALGRIDPILFTFFEMTTLAPVALGILAFTCHQLTWTLVKRGVLLGSCLCLALFTIAIALRYSTATGTAFFPALNGFLAALIAWFVFRQPMNKATWLAGILSVAGTGLLLANSPMGGVRGAVIAFLGGLFFTVYIFLSDCGQQGVEKQEELAYWPLFAVELLTMALWACLVALLFGDWQAFHPLFPKDALVILYIAGACTFLPTLITVLMQKHMSAVTVSFIYILEPILGAMIANFYLHEILPLYGYLGGGLVVIGASIHTLGSVERVEQPIQETVQKRPVRPYLPSTASLFSSYLFPAVYCCAGFLILYRLGGFPPLAWRELYQLAPTLLTWLQPTHKAAAGSLLDSLQQGTQRDFLLLLIADAICWLIGWGTLAVITCMAFFHALTQGNAPGMRKSSREVKAFKASFFDTGEIWREETSAIQEFSPIISTPPTPTHTTNAVNSIAIWGGPLDSSTLESTAVYDYYDIQDITPQDFLDITSTTPTYTNRSKEQHQHVARVELVEYVE